MDPSELSSHSRPHRARLHHPRHHAARLPRMALFSLAEVTEGKLAENRRTAVLVNASGVGAKTLGECKDADVLAI
jgi:hypothetical protein